MYPDSFYEQWGELELPRSTRTYFDSFSHEYSTYPIDRKLYDLGYMQMMGYHPLADIRALLKRRPDISEDSIIRSIKRLESKLVGDDVMWHRNSLDTELELFLHELRRRYSHTYTGDKEAHYINSKDYNEEFDRNTNGWELICRQANRFYDPEEEFYFPDDKKYFEHYNATHRKPVIINPHALPEPWYGNPLYAKIIIIAPAQVFRPDIHIEANSLLQGRADAAKGLTAFLKSQYRLLSIQMFHADESERDGVYYDDYYNSPGFRNWVNELSELAEVEGIDPEVLSANVAVVNEFPYLLAEPGTLPNDCLPPSQHVLRRMMMVRICSNDDSQPLFILPRATRKRHTYWSSVMDGTWDGTWGARANKVIGRMSNRDMTLSPEGFGRKAYARVIAAIRAL